MFLQQDKIVEWIPAAASKKLKEAMELEYFKYFQKQKTHMLYYEEYLRAKELGIELPEAQPQFGAGLICDEYDQVVEVVMPKEFRLEDCYLCSDGDCCGNLAEINAHLLGALGKFEEKPFVPVTIDKGYMGYSWTKLPKVIKVKVKTGKELLRQGILSEELACFDELSITVHTSDGKVITSDVCMAIIEAKKKGKYQWCDHVVCVTKEARETLGSDNIWYHLGGFNVEGDCYETQQYSFEKDLDEFWNALTGPYETMRREIYSILGRQYSLHDKWKKISVTSEGTLEILFHDGRTEIVIPPN